MRAEFPGKSFAFSNAFAFVGILKIILAESQLKRYQ